jgi:hypothetical protein
LFSVQGRIGANVAMIRKGSNVEIVVPTVLAVVLAIVLSIGAIHLTEIFLGPIEQVEAHQPGSHWLPLHATPRQDELSKPPARRWTSSEDDKLRDMLDVGRTADKIAVELNRTHPAIYSRLQRLYRKRAWEARLVEFGLKLKK